MRAEVFKGKKETELDINPVLLLYEVYAAIMRPAHGR
jgi:hypothetical protein